MCQLIQKSLVSTPITTIFSHKCMHFPDFHLPLHTWNPFDSWLCFQIGTMSTITSQPVPFDRLEREKHIQAIFTAFKNRCGPTCQCRLPLPGLTSSHQTPPPDWENQAQSSLAPPGITNGSQVENRWPAAGTHFMSKLQTVDKFEITARPEVQGGSEFLYLLSNCLQF